MDWKISPKPVAYPDAMTAMDARVAGIIDGTMDEQVWFLEHPALYTGGTSTKPEDLKDARFPVFETGRGGQYTYHGPGQRVAYVMLDLKKRHGTPDIRKYVHDLEQWIILSLKTLGITGVRRNGRIGIWVVDSAGVEAKIAALGIRVRRGVAFHGIAINVNPDLTHYDGIVPCGIAGFGVTSIRALGSDAQLNDLDLALKEHFSPIFDG
jgi:lipoyl(octanoyl) transferase